MKLLKSSLLIMTMVMIQPISAKIRVAKTPARPTTGPKTTPTAPAKETFQSLIQKIRTTRNSAEIINNEGVFTDTFESMVQSADLDPALKEALFEAGRNLHLPLSGKNKQDMSLLVQEKETVNTPVQGKFAEYYDGWTTELKQDYLEKRVQELLRQGKTTALIISLLQGDLGIKMRLAWKENNVVENILYRIEQLNKQIADTVKAMASGAIVPYKPEPLTPTTGAIVPYKPGGAIVPTKGVTYKTPEFYDEQSTFVKQGYLNKRIEQLTAQNKTSKQIIDILSSELKQGMAAVWKYHGIKITPAKLNQLQQQIQQSVNDLVIEIELATPKLPTANDYNRHAKKIVAQYPAQLDSIYETDSSGMFIKVESKEFDALVRGVIEEMRARYPKINKPNLGNALQAALFIVPAPSKKEFNNMSDAANRIFAIIDDAVVPQLDKVAKPKPQTMPHEYIRNMLAIYGENNIYKLFNKNIKNSYEFQRNINAKQFFIEVVSELHNNYPELTQNDIVEEIVDVLKQYFTEKNKQLTVTSILRTELSEIANLVFNKK